MLPNYFQEKALCIGVGRGDSMISLKNCFDNLIVSFGEFLMNIFIVNDYLYAGILICLVFSFISFAVLILIYYQQKNNSSKRIKLIQIGYIIIYNIFTAIFSFLFDWKFAIIFIILCSFLIRKEEKNSMQLESKKQFDAKLIKDTKDLDIKNNINSIKGILINILITFLASELIVFIISNN